jgi:hypothetical protein
VPISPSFEPFGKDRHLVGRIKYKQRLGRSGGSKNAHADGTVIARPASVTTIWVRPVTGVTADEVTNACRRELSRQGHRIMQDNGADVQKNANQRNPSDKTTPQHLISLTQVSTSALTGARKPSAIWKNVYGKRK